MDILTKNVSHLADLGEEPFVSSKAWVFAHGLGSLGVGFTGPVAAAAGLGAKDCLEQG